MTGAATHGTADDGDRRVLVVTTSFVPDANGRAERLRARTKYLVQEHGWSVDVLVDGGGDEAQRLALDGAECTVFRASNPDDGGGEGGSETTSPLGWLKDHARRFAFPDVHVTSLPSLVRRAQRLVETRDVDVVYTMCYPFSYHLAGVALRKLMNAGWVAEFRDPWVTNPNHFDGEAGPVHRRLERLTVETADQVVYNYGIQIPDAYFKQRYGLGETVTRLECPGSTGFDFDRLSGERPDESVFRMTYGGSFYGDGHSPIPFLRGLRRFLDTTSVQEPAMRVDFYGDWSPEYDDAVSEFDLDDVVSHHGWLRPSEFLTELERSHASLFVVRPFPGDERNVPQKVIDYVAAGAAMLVLSSPDWEAAQYTERHGVGVVADPDDVDAIAGGIRELWAAFEAEDLKRFSPSPKTRELIDARTQTVAFADVLERACR